MLVKYRYRAIDGTVQHGSEHRRELKHARGSLGRVCTMQALFGNEVVLKLKANEDDELMQALIDSSEPLLPTTSEGQIFPKMPPRS